MALSVIGVITSTPRMRSHVDAQWDVAGKESAERVPTEFRGGEDSSLKPEAIVAMGIRMSVGLYGVNCV